jgi:hypothetical protein
VWIIKEALLLHPDLQVSSKIVYSLLKGWQQVTQKLSFEFRDFPVPSSLTILQAYCLNLTLGEKFNLSHYNNLKLWTHSRGISTCSDLFANGRWLSAEFLSSQIGSSSQVGRLQFQSLMGFLVASPGMSTHSLKDAAGWMWNHSRGSLRGWAHSIKQWRLLIPALSFSTEMFNSRWGID